MSGYSGQALSRKCLLNGTEIGENNSSESNAQSTVAGGNGRRNGTYERVKKWRRLNICRFFIPRVQHCRWSVQRVPQIVAILQTIGGV